MKTIILLTMTFISVSCSHMEHAQEATVAGTCDQKIKEITPPLNQRIIDISKQATAGVASIAIAGVGAGADAVVIVITSPVTRAALCLATVSMLVSGRPASTDICNHLGEAGYNPKLMQKSLDSTKSWRCPNLDYISKGLRDVASCYLDHDEKDKAKSQLNNILTDKIISGCISEEETQEVISQMAKI
jgi:hypothetical protein